MNNKKIFTAIICAFIPVTFCYAQIEKVPEDPYFKVTYEIPKMPKEVASKEAAAKNMALYKQQLQKNKLIMAEHEKQINAQKAIIKKHNEIAVNLTKNDRREYQRVNPKNCPNPIVVTLLTDDKKKINTITPIDISRGGMSFYSKVLKNNDIIPIHIKYGNTEVKTALQVLSNNNGRIGGAFVKTNETNKDKLIYLSSILEEDSGILETKLAPL